MLKRYAVVEEINKQGYNCAQSVACAYADLTSLSQEDIYRLTECLGGGIGRMQGVCGALSGAYLIASYMNSDGKLTEGKTTKDTYERIQKMQKSFVAKVGSENCLELLNGGPPKPGICFDKLQAGCEVLEEFLQEKNIKEKNINA